MIRPSRKQGNAPPTAVIDDRHNQMMLMDSLPLSLKRIVWTAPIPLDLRQVYTMSGDYRDRAPDRLVAAILREYPGWVR